MAIHLTRADFDSQSDTSALAKASQPNDGPAKVADGADVEKMGARKNKTDAADIQGMHDTLSKMADGVHCAAYAAKPGFTTDADKAAGADLQKKGARHSAADMGLMKAAHDAMVGLGAKCDSAMTADGDGKDKETKE